MGENERGSKTSSLSRRQQSALPVIAATPTLAQAARSSGIGESAIYRWLEATDFRDELARPTHAGSPPTRHPYASICHSEHSAPPCHSEEPATRNLKLPVLNLSRPPGNPHSPARPFVLRTARPFLLSAARPLVLRGANPSALKGARPFVLREIEGGTDGRGLWGATRSPARMRANKTK